MNLFSASHYLALTRELTNFENVFLLHEPERVPDDETKIGELLDLADSSASALGLQVTSGQIRLGKAMLGKSYSGKSWEHRIRSISESFALEMEGEHFLHVPASDAKLYSQTDPFGPDASKHFPSAAYDAEEAAKCLALERSTATVFHSMRVMEIALRSLARVLPVLSLSNPNWGNILQPLQDEAKKKLPQKVAEWQTHDSFMNQAVAFLDMVRIAWRNPTMHVEAKYTKEEAVRIFEAVKAFAEHLAKEMDENGAFH